MGSRLNLHQFLLDVLGSPNVYFEKPSKKIKYPCIIYELSNDSPSYADNQKYVNRKRYAVTIMDNNPDSIFPDRLGELEYCSFDRHFVNDNIHHFVFTIFY